MYTCIYTYTSISVSISLSLYVCVYIYIYIYIFINIFLFSPFVCCFLDTIALNLLGDIPPEDIINPPFISSLLIRVCE